MTSTYDHRVIQGAESGEFLRRIDSLLQGEEGFYDTIFGALDADAAGPGRARRDRVEDHRARTRSPPRSSRDVAGAPGEVLLQAVQAATSVVKAHRMHGHLAARLDPLGTPPRGDPALDPETREPDARADAGDPRVDPARRGARRDVRRRAAASAGHLLRHDRLRDRAHRRPQPARLAAPVGRVGARHRTALDPDQKRALLKRLSEVEALESYLHKAFLGKKQFSIEGLDALVPMIDELIEEGVRRGRPRGRARHGAPRPAERARPHRRAPVRGDHRRVRGRAVDGRRHRDAGGRHRRREVPLRRGGHLPDAGRARA